MKAVIVYQCGIANVFKVDRIASSPGGRNAVRLLQHAYGPCAWFARGLAKAGWKVRTAHCDQVGDIVNAEWNPGRGDLWRDSRPSVHAN